MHWLPTIRNVYRGGNGNPEKSLHFTISLKRQNFELYAYLKELMASKEEKKKQQQHPINSLKLYFIVYILCLFFRALFLS